MQEEHYPDPPTRIVEPVVSPETAVPSSAVPCPECTISGNEALASAGRRGKAKDMKPAIDPNEEPGTKNEEL